MLLLPQLNYIGTILLPDDSTLTEIGELMDNFVVQGLIVSKKRLYTKPEMGGIGLFRPERLSSGSSMYMGEKRFQLL